MAIKKYFYTLSIALAVIFGAYQIAKAEQCVQPVYPDCRNVNCKGLPSYPTYQFEACLTKCDNDFGALQNAYYACLDRKWEADRQAQLKQQQEEEAARQEAQRQADLRAQQEEAARQAKLKQEQESQSIHQPVEDLQKELQTPGPSVPPPADLNIPPPSVGQGTPNVQYLEMKNIKKGDVLTAPADSKINILTGNGKIDLEKGSVLKFLGGTLWQAVSGAFHFVEKIENTAAANRIKVSTSNAVTSVRGTQFSINVAADGKTTVTVIKGTVNVAPAAKGKKAIDVKEGYQLIVDKKGAEKPTKFDPGMLDTWYEAAPVSSDFFNSSWTKEAAANRYRRECVFTTGQATATQTLTAEEQKIVDAINQGLAIFRAKITDSVIEKDKRLYSTKEKTNLYGTAAVQLYVDSKNIYYPGDKAGTWKTFQEKNLISGLFKMLRQQNLTFDFDQSAFAFANWEGTGKNRLAVFSGKLTDDGTADVIGTATGQSPETGQPVGTAKIYIDEESQLWNKLEITTDVQSGKVKFPLYETCQITYGDKVKVNLPSKAKKMDAKAGAAEFGKAISLVQ